MNLFLITGLTISFIIAFLYIILSSKFVHELDKDFPVLTKKYFYSNSLKEINYKKIRGFYNKEVISVIRNNNKLKWLRIIVNYLRIMVVLIPILVIFFNHIIIK